MKMANTLHRYIGRQFLARVGLVLGVIALLVLFVDVMDLLRRAGDKEVPFWVVGQMALLRLLSHIQVAFPFAIYIATMLCYSRLTASRELIVVRAAGVSVWQFLFPAMCVAAFIGVGLFGLIQPLSTVGLKLYHQQEARYFENNGLSLNLFGQSMWFKEKLEGGTALVHTQAVSLNSDGLVQLKNPMWLLMDKDHQLSDRIDASVATLMPGSWLFKQKSGSIARKTAFDRKEVENAVQEAETISFWRLPQHMKQLANSGFPSLHHQLMFHSLLVTPVLFISMVLLAALFSFSFARKGKGGMMLALGIMVGFGLYFAMNLVSTMTLSGAVSAPLGAWAPPLVMSLISAAILLHREDG